MLRKETVSAPLLESLIVLMEMETIKAHRLVGGTALALQIGHRMSIDIDLFSDGKTDSCLGVLFRCPTPKLNQIIKYAFNRRGALPCL